MHLKKKRKSSKQSKNRMRFIFILYFFYKCCYVFTFLKTFKYEFFDCKENKNKYEFYCPHYPTCHCSNLYHVYNNNYNNNYSFVIPIWLQSISKPYLFVRSSQRRTLNRNWLTHTWLTELLLTGCLLCLSLLHAHTFSLQNVLKVEGSCSRFLEDSIATVCFCAFLYFSVPHACRCGIIWKVFDVFVSVHRIHTVSCLLWLYLHYLCLRRSWSLFL